MTRDLIQCSNRECTQQSTLQPGGEGAQIALESDLEHKLAMLVSLPCFSIDRWERARALLLPLLDGEHDAQFLLLLMQQTAEFGCSSSNSHMLSECQKFVTNNPDMVGDALKSVLPALARSVLALPFECGHQPWCKLGHAGASEVSLTRPQVSSLLGALFLGMIVPAQFPPEAAWLPDRPSWPQYFEAMLRYFEALEVEGDLAFTPGCVYTVNNIAWHPSEEHELTLLNAAEAASEALHSTELLTRESVDIKLSTGYLTVERTSTADYLELKATAHFAEPLSAPSSAQHKTSSTPQVLTSPSCYYSPESRSKPAKQKSVPSPGKSTPLAGSLLTCSPRKPMQHVGTRVRLTQHERHELLEQICTECDCNQPECAHPSHKLVKRLEKDFSTYVPQPSPAASPARSTRAVLDAIFNECECIQSPSHKLVQRLELEFDTSVWPPHSPSPSRHRVDPSCVTSPPHPAHPHGQLALTHDAPVESTGAAVSQVSGEVCSDLQDLISRLETWKHRHLVDCAPWLSVALCCPPGPSAQHAVTTFSLSRTDIPAPIKALQIPGGERWQLIKSRLTSLTSRTGTLCVDELVGFIATIRGDLGAPDGGVSLHNLIEASLDGCDCSKILFESTLRWTCSLLLTIPQELPSAPLFLSTNVPHVALTHRQVAIVCAGLFWGVWSGLPWPPAVSIEGTRAMLEYFVKLESFGVPDGMVGFEYCDTPVATKDESKSGRTGLDWWKQPEAWVMSTLLRWDDTEWNYGAIHDPITFSKRKCIVS